MITMFDGEYLILCSGKSSDANGNITLSGIFDGIIAQGFPTVRPDLLVTAQLRAKRAIINRELEIKLVVEIENDTVLNAELKQNVTVEKDNGFSFDFNLQGMPFPRAGKYFFKLYIDGTLYLTRTLRVKPMSDLVEP